MKSARIELTTQPLLFVKHYALRYLRLRGLPVGVRLSAYEPGVRGFDSRYHRGGGGGSKVLVFPDTCHDVAREEPRRSLVRSWRYINELETYYFFGYVQ